MNNVCWGMGRGVGGGVERGVGECGRCGKVCWGVESVAGGMRKCEGGMEKCVGVWGRLGERCGNVLGCKERCAWVCVE